MALKEAKYIWINGKFVEWKDAKIHILSHVVHYGSSVFEGVRCYNTPKGSAIFRLHNHTFRLINSAKIYRMESNFSADQINQAILQTIKKNDIKHCYIRPLIYRGYDSLGVNPFACPVDTAIAVWEWGKYLGEEALTRGVDVMVSTWTRMAPNTFPAMAKSGANYMNSQLIKMEAILNGYVEGIALDTAGYICEGSGENIFIVKDGIIYTPPLGASILAGITRDTIIKLAKEKGYTIKEQILPREMLYICDEAFFTGSAAEVTPIATVDKIKVGRGRRGPITEELQTAYFDLIDGKIQDKYSWLTYI